MDEAQHFINYHGERADDMTLYFGLIGEHLQHSLSPGIHKLIFDRAGLDACYHLFEIDPGNLKSAMTGLKVLGFSGVNVTIPYKSDIMKYIDSFSKEAHNIGAVNTIAFDNGRATGYNTDYTGFGDMLKSFDVQIAQKKAVVLGTGGASHAVVQYLIDNGAKEIYLVTRNSSERREGIIHTMPLMSSNLVDYKQLELLPEMDILINCTPCGMFPDTGACPVTKNQIAKYQVAVDLIYNPAETMFLRYANELGLKTLNGLYMLVSQAAAAEKVWNNITTDAGGIKDIYEQLLYKSHH